MGLARGKKVLFRLIPTLIVAVILVAAELLLRWRDPSLANPFVKPVTVDGIEWFQINRSYLRKYFPTNAPMVPEFKPSLVRKTKPPDLFRIVCLGGSSMFGTPYTMTGTIPGIIRRELRHRYPGRAFEVVNLGASAINSNVVRDLMDNVVALQPDLVLIYMGHNEFYGPDGIGASVPEQWFPSLIPLKYGLRDFSLVEWILRVTMGEGESLRKAEARNLMQQVSKGNTVDLHSGMTAHIVGLFRSNLSSILGTLAAQNIPTLVSDVTSNLRFPPFASPPLSVAAQSQLREAEQVLLQGDYARAARMLDALCTQDSVTANVVFSSGMAHRAIGDSLGARSLLVRAKDLDLLKFRAPEEINRAIRTVCKEFHVPVISADSAFAAQSPGHIQGDNLFWEHLHPNLRGYYVIAESFLSAMTQTTTLTKRSALPFNPDSLSVCWLDRAYADLSVQSLTGSWPFENYRRSPEVFQAADSTLQRIALAAYRRTMLWDEACYASAGHFWRTGQVHEAETTYRALLEERPFDFYANYLLGSLLNSTGRVEEAARHYEVSVRSNPSFPNSHLDLGLLDINLGKFDDAITQFKAAEGTFTGSTRPAFKANVYYGLGAALANKGEYDRAMEYLDNALGLLPGYPDALRLRGALLQEMTTSSRP